MRAWNWIGFGFYLFFVTAGVAGPLEDGNAALAKGDYFTAFKALSPLAEEGNSTAQSALGFMYAFGQGVARDAEAGVKWYRRSAEQGNAEAQSSLGVMLAMDRALRETPPKECIGFGGQQNKATSSPNQISQ
jgi:TPR repeat protein